MEKRRKTSELWGFFEPKGKYEATCNLCKCNLSFKGSLSNLKKHLARKHPTICLPSNLPPPVTTHVVEANPHHNQSLVIDENTPVIVVSANQPEKCFETVFPSTSTENVELTKTVSLDTNLSKQVSTKQPIKKQTVLPTFVPKKITANEKGKIDLAIMKFISWDFQPFTVVEDKGFRNLMNTCVPSYNIPSRKYFSNTMLPALYEEKKTELKNILKNESLSVCLTSDGWSSPTNDSYNAVTAHYINEQFDMKSVTLECSAFNESHTSENLAQEILRVANDWEISDKVLLMTTDNASNITGAIKILKWKHYGCYAHKINLLLQAAFSPVEDILKKVKSIVTFFKRSNNATQLLLKYQKQTGVTQPKKLLQDVVTRWNSTYFMVERFVLLKDAVKHALALSDTEHAPLTSDEWETCKQLSEVLEPCYEVTKEMSSEKYLTASKIIPITRGLKASLTKLSNHVTSTAVQEVVKKMLQGISERFPNLERSGTFRLCTFLDPRYKHHVFEDASTVESAKRDAIELITGLINKKLRSEQQTEPDEGNKDKDEGKEKKISIWDEIDETISKVKPQGNATSQAITEVQRYMDEEPLDRKKNPLKWWKENCHFYPNLSHVVRTRCHVVATSVPCERVFSKAGCLISERRTRLTTKKVKELMFLNMNI